MRRKLRKSMVAMAALVLSGCVSSNISPLGWYPTHGGKPPENLRLTICHAFGCMRSDRVQLTQSDARALELIMAAGRDDAAAERAAIAEAVMYVERRVGPIVGSDSDVGGFDLHNAGVPGQMDCLDETSNTMSTLLLLEQLGLIRHHRISYPVARGFFLDGRYLQSGWKPAGEAKLRASGEGERGLLG